MPFVPDVDDPDDFSVDVLGDVPSDVVQDSRKDSAERICKLARKLCV